MFRKIAEVLEQKLINYLQVFHKIRVLENPSKYNLSYSKGITYRRVPLHWLWILLAKILQKKNSTAVFFFRVWRKFFRVDVKNNSCWIAQNILSEKVRQVKQRRGGETRVAMKLQKKTKKAIKKALMQTFSRYFKWNLS